jgi:transposase InsO family protein
MSRRPSPDLGLLAAGTAFVVELYHQRRPHASLGPGIPDVPLDVLARQNGHRIPDGHRVIAAQILAGLHHE